MYSHLFNILFCCRSFIFYGGITYSWWWQMVKINFQLYEWHYFV